VVQENTYLIKINLNEIFCSSIIDFAFKSNAQELFVMTEPASNMPAGSIEL
jgi:hypothetical protein